MEKQAKGVPCLSCGGLNTLVTSIPQHDTPSVVSKSNIQSLVMFFKVSPSRRVCVSILVCSRGFLVSLLTEGLLTYRSLANPGPAVWKLCLQVSVASAQSPPKSLPLREAFPASLHRRTRTTPNHTALASFQGFFICYWCYVTSCHIIYLLCFPWKYKYTL